MMDSGISHARQIVEIGRKMHTRGYISGTDGNISIRTDHDRIVITPSGSCKGFLKYEDMIVVDSVMTVISGAGKPSSESDMHLSLYKLRPDIKACVHAHPPYATAFAVAGEELPGDILPEVALFVGPIPLVPFTSPGTTAVGAGLEVFAADHDAFLLKNHGVVTIGTNLEEAYNRMETVEHFAKILFYARQIGTVDHLPEEEVVRLTRMREVLRKNSV